MIVTEFRTDNYKDVYGEQYQDKIDELKKAITEPGDGNEFKVFSIEAGLGKSKATLEIIDENLDDWEEKPLSFLLVRRFKEDVKQSFEGLNKHNHTQREYVLGITAENWGEWRYKLDKLKEIRVLIITHQRYIDLCLDDEAREAFMADRDVLIIDEKINFPIYTFSKHRYDEVRALLHTGIQQEFDKVCTKLLNELLKQEAEKNLNKVTRCEPKIHPKTLANFKETFEVNIENEKDIQKRSTLNNFLKGLEQWYTTKCVYNGGKISTFNRKYKLWGLDNNIILDASASIDGIYSLSDFEIVGTERIIDHSNSKFTIIDFNSSKSYLQQNHTEFNAEIAEKITGNHKLGDKTLVICHKDNHEKILKHLYNVGVTKIGVGDEYNGENFAINWFGNLIGKNVYSDFNQCWIIGTPNIPYEQYLIHYMMYKEADLGRKSSDIVRGRFTNEEFKAVQVGYIASEIYQSIKRIQRNEMPNGEFFIVNHDIGIVQTVLGQIKGADNVQIIMLDFEQEKKKDKKVDNVDRLVEYIYKLPKGMYEKREVFNEIGVKNNFNRFLIDARVKALLDTGDELGLGIIKIHNKHIEKLTDPEPVFNE